ncbi:serine/threonine protein kinase [Scytonema sp. HK-05]|uniref:protein kinase domain-containing protein n=1 Tax=Scytonema sp. HK-05 TaxID=1137095 RepID=UPI0009366280|nr:YARHG domain-containing protein [Scytonema sp. HK-05]OKH60455.1 serine/threonine protein kinase [Scytonema sp. HK-05]BAY44745.1 serine/threonine protein kinase [Scytonema sp. HK-05]
MTLLLNNRYRILRTLGSGGFGETFLAEDTQMPSLRRCVIKQLKPIHNKPEIYQLVQERFQREAAILEELGGSSGQIPALYAYFQLNEQFYLVQEYIEGDTLTAKVKQQGVLSESAVRELLLTLLPVLEYIHSNHIVHRDVKPDNIILRHRDGKPVLIDFGAVRETMGTVINSKGSLASSIIIGTPGYMPSEQAMGRPVYVSDLYSLGITVIYLLTGKHPQELETDPHTGEIIWRSHALNVSPTMIFIIDKAIAYHPRDRFASAREMLQALQEIANTILPTQPPSQRPRIAAAPTAKTQNTISITRESSQIPSSQDSKDKGILIGSIIAAGGLIGASTIIGLVLTKSSQPVAQKTVSPSVQLPSVTPQAIETPDHQSVPSPLTPSVLSANDYSWLSQRLVTDEDLEGKSGFELDIMRNSIFARYGRRFNTPGLQKYFNLQPWYRPIYSPMEFDQRNVLSDLERRNVEYISEYQNRYDRRYFKK